MNGVLAVFTTFLICLPINQISTKTYLAGTLPVQSRLPTHFRMPRASTGTCHLGKSAP